MNKKANIPDIPLCINVLRLQSYLLAPDELILFDWLVVKQISFHYKPFHYSQSRIEEETRIKRSRQEAIIAKFTEWNIVETEVLKNNVTKGMVRYFCLHFNVLTEREVLELIIDRRVSLYTDFRKYVTFHSEQQAQALIPPPKKERLKVEDAEGVYQMLNEVYEQRRVMYNKGELTSGELPTRLRVYSQLQYNKTIAKKLIKMHSRYESSTIKNAFIAYIDNSFTQKDFLKPKNLMNFFLTYNPEKDEFSVFDFYLNKFLLSYSMSRAK